jgi:hypothetical protein
MPCSPPGQGERNMRTVVLDQENILFMMGYQAVSVQKSTESG